MRLGMLVVITGLGAGCAATQPRETAQPPELEDGTWGHEGSLVASADSADSEPARAGATSDTDAAVASVAESSNWRGAGDDRPTERRDDGPKESKLDAWLHRDRASAAYEERLVGDNNQPEWTTARRFTSTQAYVLAPGQMVLEQWITTQAPRHLSPRHLFQTEASFGIDGGLEVDLYERFGQLPSEDHVGAKHIGVEGEVRYALAKWGVIPLNPTIVGGFLQNHRAPDVAELKILLATDFGGGGWHWAADFGVFRETEVEHARDLQATMGISKTLCDSRWSIGAEAKFDSVSVRHHRSDPERQLLVGPSLQWRPTANTHLDIAPLFGVVTAERRDPRVELEIIFGIDFGPEQEGRYRRDHDHRDETSRRD